MDDEMLKAAQQQVAQAMNSAMGNIENSPSSTESSDSIKPNLSAETVVEENLEYVEPMQDPYKKAITYLENHNIMQMFQQLTSSIVYKKPEKPLEFMMQEVERMKKEKEKEAEEQKQKKK